jgi:transcriptional regulator with XRE-family HTH domain
MTRRMNEPTTDFGQELRKLRCQGEIKYTQAQLADLAGIKAGYISQLETGKKNPTVRVIHKLSPHLGVPSNHLLRIIGMVEMNLAGTFANNRDQVRDNMPNLTEQQIEELADYLTYLDFKASALK